jgi:hypothetical protein
MSSIEILLSESRIWCGSYCREYFNSDLKDDFWWYLFGDVFLTAKFLVSNLSKDEYVDLINKIPSRSRNFWPIPPAPLLIDLTLQYNRDQLKPESSMQEIYDISSLFQPVQFTKPGLREGVSKIIWIFSRLINKIEAVLYFLCSRLKLFDQKPISLQRRALQESSDNKLEKTLYAILPYYFFEFRESWLLRRILHLGDDRCIINLHGLSLSVSSRLYYAYLYSRRPKESKKFYIPCHGYQHYISAIYLYYYSITGRALGIYHHFLAVDNLQLKSKNRRLAFSILLISPMTLDRMTIIDWSQYLIWSEKYSFLLRQLKELSKTGALQCKLKIKGTEEFDRSKCIFEEKYFNIEKAPFESVYQNYDLILISRPSTVLGKCILNSIPHVCLDHPFEFSSSRLQNYSRQHGFLVSDPNEIINYIYKLSKTRNLNL